MCIIINVFNQLIIGIITMNIPRVSVKTMNSNQISLLLKYNLKDVNRKIRLMFQDKIERQIIYPTMRANGQVEHYNLPELESKMFVAKYNIEFLEQITQFWINNNLKKQSPSEILSDYSKVLASYESKIENFERERSILLNILVPQQTPVQQQTPLISNAPRHHYKIYPKFIKFITTELMIDNSDHLNYKIQICDLKELWEIYCDVNNVDKYLPVSMKLMIEQTLTKTNVRYGNVRVYDTVRKGFYGLATIDYNLKKLPLFDVNGLPWDDRINATTHNKNKDGSWKISRRKKSFGTNQKTWIEYVKLIQEELLRNK